jgi:hypothetical protein
MKQFWPSAAEGYRALFEACAAQPACAAAYPDLASEFTAAVRRLAKAHLSVDLPDAQAKPSRRVVIDGYTLANLAPLRLRHCWPASHHLGSSPLG